MGSCHAPPKKQPIKLEINKKKAKQPAASCPVSPKNRLGPTIFSQTQLPSNSELQKTTHCPKQLLKLHQVPLSQHYSVIYEKQLSKNLNLNQGFVQNNFNGKIRIVETLPKSVPEHTNYIQSLLTYNLNHPNLISVYDIYEDTTSYKIIFENYTGNILSMKNDGIGMLEEKVGSIVKQIIDLLLYIHSLKLTHGSLQLESFAITEQNDTITIKLLDLKGIFVKEPVSLQTAHYTAPEVFRDSNSKGKPKDIWSLGVITYFLLTGFLPFQGNTLPKVSAEIRRGAFDTSSIQFDKISKDAKEFIQNVLVISPANRMELISLTKTNWMIKQKKKTELKVKSDLQNLRKLKKINLLQYCFLQHMVNQYMSEQSTVLFQAFNDLDANKDGKITKYELMNAYQKIYDDSQAFQVVNDIFASVDQDGNGEIEIQEYILALADRRSMLTEEHLRDTFKLLSNKKGFITQQSILLNFNVKEESITNEFANRSKKFVFYLFNQISYQDFKSEMLQLII